MSNMAEWGFYGRRRERSELEQVLFIHADLELPPEPGVYFVATKQGSILYIGQSMNMRERWSHGHHRVFECLRAGAHYIHYQYTEEPYDLEQLYLEEYDPAKASRSLYKPP